VAAVIRVVCIGNEIASDDGIGIRVGRTLASLPLPDGVEVVLRDAAGFELLDDCPGCERLIFVDAASTGAVPGTCRVTALDAFGPSPAPGLSTHAFGLLQVLELARRVRSLALTTLVSVVTIEAESFEPNCLALSPRVAEALPTAVDLVLDLVGASEAVRSVARERARASGGPLRVQDLVRPAK
jgi:hydrogenase maturation protease